MHAERNKILLVVLLLAVAVGVYFWLGRAQSPVAGSVQFVCVSTGKLYRISQEDIPSILPAVNPSTGEKTLLPTEEKDGKLIANPRFAFDALRDPELAKVNKYVDPTTLEVLDSPR